MKPGYQAGEICIIVGAPPRGDHMLGRIVEIAESKVYFQVAQWRLNPRLFTSNELAMQLCCKPRTREPLGAYPVMWLRPYDGGNSAYRRDLTAFADPSHRWLMLDPEHATTL